MNHFDTPWEDHEDDIQGDTPLEELQDYFPHVNIIDIYDTIDEWELLEDEAIEEAMQFNKAKKETRERRDTDL